MIAQQPEVFNKNARIVLKMTVSALAYPLNPFYTFIHKAGGASILRHYEVFK
jgi:hypothetical protein